MQKSKVPLKLTTWKPVIGHVALKREMATLMHEESNNHLLLQSISFCKQGLKKSLHQGFEINRGTADLHKPFFLQETNNKKLNVCFY